MHRATESQVFTVVAFSATRMSIRWGCGALAEMNTSVSVPAGLQLVPCPRCRFACRTWPGTIKVPKAGVNAYYGIVIIVIIVTIIIIIISSGINPIPPTVIDRD